MICISYMYDMYYKCTEREYNCHEGYTYACTYTHTCTYTYTQTHACTYKIIHIHVHEFIVTRYIYAYKSPSRPSLAQELGFIYIRIHTHAHIHIQSYIYVYTYICAV